MRYVVAIMGMDELLIAPARVLACGSRQRELVRLSASMGVHSVNYFLLAAFIALLICPFLILYSLTVRDRPPVTVTLRITMKLKIESRFNTEGEERLFMELEVVSFCMLTGDELTLFAPMDGNTIIEVDRLFGEYAIITCWDAPEAITEWNGRITRFVPIGQMSIMFRGEGMNSVGFMTVDQ